MTTSANSLTTIAGELPIAVRQSTWGSNAQAGDPGLLIQTLADPSALF